MNKLKLIKKINKFLLENYNKNILNINILYFNNKHHPDNISAEISFNKLCFYIRNNNIYIQTFDSEDDLVLDEISFETFKNIILSY